MPFPHVLSHRALPPRRSSNPSRRWGAWASLLTFLALAACSADASTSKLRARTSAPEADPLIWLQRSDMTECLVWIRQPESGKAPGESRVAEDTSANQVALTITDPGSESEAVEFIAQIVEDGSNEDLRIQIADRTYQLERGRVFLVDNRSDEIQVTQLRRTVVVENLLGFSQDTWQGPARAALTKLVAEDPKASTWR